VFCVDIDYELMKAKKGEILKHFRVFCTTKRLLSLATIKSKYIFFTLLSFNNIYKKKFFHTFFSFLFFSLAMSPHIMADGTYKLIYHGHSILIFGTTDLGKHFHPFGWLLLYNKSL